MEYKNTRSWHGRDALKADVLAQMQTHYDDTELGIVQIGAESLNIYGWNKELDYPLCAKTLGLDEGVLHLGFYLWEGFPEDKKGIKTLIQLRMELLDSIPVGADLNHICNEFILWRLENADFGIINPQTEQEVKALLLEVSDAFYQDKPDLLPLRQKVDLAIQAVNDSIRTLWQKEQKTDPDAYRTLNALETAAAACTAFVKASAAADTAQAYIFGANGTNVRNLEVEIDVMSDKLLQLLRAISKSK